MQLAPRRLRWRLSLWYAISLTLIFSLFSVCVFLFVRVSCMIPIHAQLDQEISLLEKAIDKSLADVSKLETDGVVPYFRITGNTQPFYISRSWPSAQLPDKASANHKGYWLKSADGRHYFVQHTTLSQAGKTLHIEVAQDAEQAYESVKKLEFALLISIPFVLFISLGGGYIFAGRVLAPIDAMARKAHEITVDKLSERLAIQNPADEFGHLARVFNETFERLEGAFERLRRFTADASHELRTPLAVIRCVGENALQLTRTPEQYENAIGSMLEETDRLLSLLDGLLMLTRAEAGQLPLKPENIALGEFSLSVVNCLRVLAEEKHQSVLCDCEAEVYALADRTTLRLALINLVANAIRYTPEYGTITVKVRLSPTGLRTIEVHDTGPGIAPAHQRKIFERFYRIDRDRSRETGGAGLGLAIARWVVELNGGTIELESKEGSGSVFRIALKV